MTNIKNIIFDLGGVLLNIDFNRSITAFEKLGIENFQEMFSQHLADELFVKLETGKMSEEEFYTAIKKRTSAGVTNGEIENAWNAMILDFRTESLRFLEKLSTGYKLYLLSNTNAIHLKYFQQTFMKETGKPLLDDYFIKAWYSHKVGLRKPLKEIYEFVLRDENLVAAETLFIDDTAGNIETAKNLGYKTYHLKPTERIEDILV